MEKDYTSLRRAEAVLAHWARREQDALVWDAEDAEFKSYMDAIASLQSLHDRTAGETAPHTTRELHESAKRLLLNETPKLEEGLLHILQPYSTAASPEKVYEAYKAIVSLNRTFQLHEADVPIEERGVCFIPENALWRLHLIVRAMVRRRLVRRCCRVIKSARRPALLDSLRQLAQGRFNSRNVPNLTWADLQNRVEQWRAFVKVAVHVLLASERRICERVFNNAELSEYCFAEISSSSEKLLFEFIEAFASSKKSPERLFPLLESYETLLELQPTFNDVFAGQGPCKALRNEMSVSMSRVGVAVRGVFSEFESHIEKEPSRPPPNGSVHALTNYVVNYLNCLYAYTDTLTKLYASTGSVVIVVPKLLRAPQDDEEDEGEEFVEEDMDEDSSSSQDDAPKFYGEPLPKYKEACSLISKKLQCLENALTKKAQQHIKEREKQQFFLMNNLHYMARKVKETDLRRLLGDDWIWETAEKVQEHANEYMRHTWNKLTAILKEEPPSSGGVGFMRTSAKNHGKDKLARFCVAFDEVCKVQCLWLVNRGPLQKELEQAVKRRVVPLYSDAFEKHVGSTLASKALPKNVKHPSIINELINQLFDGKSQGSS